MIDIYILILLILPWKKRKLFQRLCSLLCHGSKWQSVFEPSSSGCALVYDANQQPLDHHLLIPKAVCYKETFFKRKAFLKRRKSLHVSHTHLQTLTKRMLNAAAYIRLTKKTKAYRHCSSVSRKKRKTQEIRQQQCKLTERPCVSQVVI